MRLLGHRALSASPLALVALVGLVGLVGALPACTAQGSTTTVQGSSGGTSGTATAPDLTSDGGTSLDGSTGPIDYDALFGPPASTSATPNTLDGLWAGTDRGLRDMRMVISSSSLAIAKQCSRSSGSHATGITVASRNTTSLIKTLESKSAPDSIGVTCDLDVRPSEAKRCAATSDAEAQAEASRTADGCFFLGGTTLNFYGTFLDRVKLTKLSD